MIILTELDSAGKVVLDHGTAVAYSTGLENQETMALLKNRMATFASMFPDKTYAIVRTTYHIIERTGEPHHPCG